MKMQCVCRQAAVAACVIQLSGAAPLFAEGAKAASPKSDAKKNQAPAPPTDNYDSLLAAYLKEARAQLTAPTPGALWMAGLMGDLRARNVNDLVTVQVVETITAQGSADSSLDKSSKGTASVGNLFGLESKYPGWLDPTSLASLGANTSFKGGGNTSRSGSLSAVMTARVADVLPNGNLVVEGKQEVRVNFEIRELIVAGIVRPEDIESDNTIDSTKIAQARIAYGGRGQLTDVQQPRYGQQVLDVLLPF